MFWLVLITLWSCLDYCIVLLQVILDARESGVNPSGNSSNPSNWDFGSSFFFAGTVVTTIGKLTTYLFDHIMLMDHMSSVEFLQNWSLANQKSTVMIVRINVDIVPTPKAMEISRPPHTQGRFSVCFTLWLGSPLTWPSLTSSASVSAFIWGAWSIGWCQWCPTRYCWKLFFNTCHCSHAWNITFPTIIEFWQGMSSSILKGYMMCPTRAGMGNLSNGGPVWVQVFGMTFYQQLIKTSLTALNIFIIGWLRGNFKNLHSQRLSMDRLPQPCTKEIFEGSL